MPFPHTDKQAGGMGALLGRFGQAGYMLSEPLPNTDKQAGGMGALLGRFGQAGYMLSEPLPNTDKLSFSFNYCSS